MLYIFDKSISNSNSLLHSLTVLYGINKYQAMRICKHIGVNPNTYINELTKSQVKRLINYINKNIKIEQLLKKDKKEQNEKLITIKTNRGIRRKLGLPVRGQRTHTNAKTCKRRNEI